MERTNLPPHGVYLPIDLPDTTVKTDKVYWITCREVSDQDSPIPLTIYYCWTAGHEYSNGRMLLPHGHVKVERDAYFRILATCPPVPLLRQASASEFETLPKREDQQIIWNASPERR